MNIRSRYRLWYALVAWCVLLVFASVVLPSHRAAVSATQKLGLIGCTLVLSAYTLLALAFNLQDQARAIKAADHPTARKLWLAVQLVLLTLAATAIIWAAWPK